LACRKFFPEFGRVGLHEERHVLRNLSGKVEAQPSDKEIVRVRFGFRVADGVGLELPEHAKLEVYVFIDLDNGLRGRGQGTDGNEQSGTRTRRNHDVHRHAVRTSKGSTGFASS